MKFRLEMDNQTHKIEIINDDLGKIAAIHVDDQKFPISDLTSFANFDITQKDEIFSIKNGLKSFNLKLKELTDDLEDNSSFNNSLNQMKEFFKNNQLLAPMPGKILDMRIKEGDFIEKGKILLSLEAMKMENEIHTPYNITIAKIHITTGDSVTDKQLLLEYELKDDA